MRLHEALSTRKRRRVVDSYLLGQALKRWREERGWSVRDMAVVLHSHPSWIHRVETGKGKLDICQLLNYLGWSDTILILTWAVGTAERP